MAKPAQGRLATLQGFGSAAGDIAFSSCGVSNLRRERLDPRALRVLLDGPAGTRLVPCVIVLREVLGLIKDSWLGRVRNSPQRPTRRTSPSQEDLDL
jgi:hypothetical protein